MRDLLRAALSTQLEEPTLLGDHVVLYRNVGVGVRVYREVGVYKYVCVYTRIESHIGCEGGVVCVPSCRHPDTSPQVIFLVVPCRASVCFKRQVFNILAAL